MNVFIPPDETFVVKTVFVIDIPSLFIVKELFEPIARKYIDDAATSFVFILSAMTICLLV